MGAQDWKDGVRGSDQEDENVLGKLQHPGPERLAEPGTHQEAGGVPGVRAGTRVGSFARTASQ